MEIHTAASSSAQDTKNNLKRRKRADNAGYHMPNSTVPRPAPNFQISDQYGDSPLRPALDPLARALCRFDDALLKRVQKFYQNGASTLDEARKAKGIPLVEECINISRQWKEIDSGRQEFNELYMKSTHLIPLWREGLQIIKATLGSNQNSSNQSQRNAYRTILAKYESLADNLKTQMVDTAHQGLLETDVLISIQKRWTRLDDVVDWYYDMCNQKMDEDEPRVFRSSPTWSEVRRMVQTDDLETSSDMELIQVKSASRPMKGTKPGTIDAFILWLVFFSCAIMSTVFFALGYGRSLHVQGTSNDADFWFLIQATLMQVLGLVVSALLEWERGGLPKWRWILPTAIAGYCSITAIPLYLFVPKVWSSYLSLVAGATQTYMTLQFRR